MQIGLAGESVRHVPGHLVRELGIDRAAEIGRRVDDLRAIAAAAEAELQPRQPTVRAVLRLGCGRNDRVVPVAQRKLRKGVGRGGPRGARAGR